MRAHLARFLPVAVLGAVLVLAPTGAGASVAASKNGCKYLKGSEVTEVLGTAVKKAKSPVAPPSTEVCGYKVTAEAGQSVNLWVQGGAAGAAGYAGAKRAFKDDVEPVSGLGRKAFYVGGGLNTAYMLSGDTLVYVQYVAIGGPDDATVKDDVTQLAKIVLGRI